MARSPTNLQQTNSLEPARGWNLPADRKAIRATCSNARNAITRYKDGIKLVRAIARDAYELGVSPAFLINTIRKASNPQLSKKALSEIVADEYGRQFPKAPGRGSLEPMTDSADVFDDDDWMEPGGRTGAEWKESHPWDMLRLSEMLDYAESAMLNSGAPLYQIYGRLVHPIRVTGDAPGEDDGISRRRGSLITREVSQLRLNEYMTEHCLFFVEKKNEEVPIAPTLRLSAQYLERNDKWGLPILRGVLETPTLRDDGTVLIDEGYDPTSGFLLDLDGVHFPKIKDKPTRDDAIAALTALKEPFAGFPFVGNKRGSASRSVILAAVLTAIVRRGLPSAPLFATSAPTMGTGKTLALNVVAMIATGRAQCVMNQGASVEEDEKRYFAALRSGDSSICIDNVSRPITGDSLCSILTEPRWRNRVLGESREIEVPTNVLWTASGNNLTFEGDMRTRALLCRMDAGIEHPEQRSFDVDLKRWVPQHRPALVAAALTVLRAYALAGQDERPSFKPFGRFERWDAVVRGALLWLGEPDPCQTRAFIESDDTTRSEHALLMATMLSSLTPGKRYTATEIFTEALECSDGLLQQALDNIDDRFNAKKLGHYLKRMAGRIVEGMRIDIKIDKVSKINTYRVVKATTG